MLPASMSTSPSAAVHRDPSIPLQQGGESRRAERLSYSKVRVRSSASRPGRLAISFAVGDSVGLFVGPRLSWRSAALAAWEAGALTAPARMVYHRDVLCRGYSDKSAAEDPADRRLRTVLSRQF